MAAIKPETAKQQMFNTNNNYKHIGSRACERPANAQEPSPPCITTLTPRHVQGCFFLWFGFFAAYGFVSRNTEKFPSCHVYDPDLSELSKRGSSVEKEERKEQRIDVFRFLFFCVDRVWVFMHITIYEGRSIKKWKTAVKFRNGKGQKTYWTRRIRSLGISKKICELGMKIRHARQFVRIDWSENGFESLILLSKYRKSLASNLKNLKILRLIPSRARCKYFEALLRISLSNAFQKALLRMAMNISSVSKNNTLHSKIFPSVARFNDIRDKQIQEA